MSGERIQRGKEFRGGKNSAGEKIHTEFFRVFVFSLYHLLYLSALAHFLSGPGVIPVSSQGR